MWTQCCLDVGPTSKTAGQHQKNIGSTCLMVSVHDMPANQYCQLAKYTRTIKSCHGLANSSISKITKIIVKYKLRIINTELISQKLILLPQLVYSIMCNVVTSQTRNLNIKNCQNRQYECHTILDDWRSRSILLRNNLRRALLWYTAYSITKKIMK